MAIPDEDNEKLGPQPKCYQGMKTLVLDLDETLVHHKREDEVDHNNPGFLLHLPHKKAPNSKDLYVLKRPYVDLFLKTMSKYFEVVVFTAG